MRIAYFDCFSGVIGDMVLGALLDIGVDFEELQAELAKLPLTEYAMAAKPVTRGPIGATKVSVKAVEKGLVRTFSNIRQIIEQSDLVPPVKARSLAIFQRLAEAQAKVSRKNVETVHFHEVGAIDSVVDIVGTAIGFHLLNVERVYCSPLPLGLGMIRTEHGMMPVPSPVTLEIIRGVPVYSTSMQAELVSPTGAAIVRSYVNEFGNMPPLTVDRIGYGAGRLDLEVPNVLRLVVGELIEPATSDIATSLTAIVEKLDDQARDDLVDKLMRLGALDVWLTTAGRARKQEVLELNVLATPDREEDLIRAIFETTPVDDLRLSRRSLRRRPEK